MLALAWDVVLARRLAKGGLGVGESIGGVAGEPRGVEAEGPAGERGQQIGGEGEAERSGKSEQSWQALSRRRKSQAFKRANAMWVGRLELWRCERLKNEQMK